MKAARQEELLKLAEDLKRELSQVDVRLVEGGPHGAPVERGIPGSCLGHVTAMLHRERKLEPFRAFVGQLGELDTMVGQNQENPRAQHAALKRVLQPWLERNNNLGAEECLYVLAWTRRLLPAEAKRLKNSPDSGRSKQSYSGETPPPEPKPDPLEGNQFARALAKARAEAERKNK